jgi:hypothetical protein
MKISNGRIHLPNLQPVPNDGSGRGVKAAINTWFAMHAGPILMPSVIAQPPTYDFPPHLALMSTASCFEEITDTYILQVLVVSSPKLLTNPATPIDANDANADDDSDDSNGELNIFKVFAAKKKKCLSKAPCLPKAVPRKSVLPKTPP